MSDPRYQGAIIAGIAKSHGVGGWPPEIPRLGPAVHGAFGLCEVCRHGQRDPQQGLNGSWTTYGGRQLCMHHARELATKRNRKAAA
jgi:hypothetical protein